MVNHQNEKGSKGLYRNVYALKNDQQLVVRTPVVGDEQGLVDHMKAVDCETKFLAREPGEFGFTLEQEREFIKSCVDNDSVHFLVGEMDGKIIANCSVGIINNNKRYLHRASMGIAVREAYWGKGIGKILMQECILWCKEKGVEQLELEVVTENERGVSLYKDLGFQIYGTKMSALKYGDGTYADEYYMMLFLKDSELVRE